MPYGTLVIASGAHPRRLTVPGGDLPAVQTFRTLADAVALAQQAPEARKILVVGGSFIGSEVAASLRMLGLEVTLVARDDHLVPALASEELSSQVADLYREHGVELLLGEQIQEFRANGRSLTGAVTASGQEIEAFVAVVGVGVEPGTEFLEGSGLELDNGVVVDDHFRRRSRTSTRSATSRASTTPCPGARAGSSTGAMRTARGRISAARLQAAAATPTPRSRCSSPSCSTSSSRCSATRVPASTRS